MDNLHIPLPTHVLMNRCEYRKPLVHLILYKLKELFSLREIRYTNRTSNKFFHFVHQSIGYTLEED